MVIWTRVVSRTPSILVSLRSTPDDHMDRLKINRPNLGPKEFDKIPTAALRRQGRYAEAAKRSPNALLFWLSLWSHRTDMANTKAGWLRLGGITDRSNGKRVWKALEDLGLLEWRDGALVLTPYEEVIEETTEPAEITTETELKPADEEDGPIKLRIAEIPEDQSTEVPTEAIDLIEELRQQANASDDDERYIRSIQSFRSTGQKACGLTREQAQPLWKAYSLEVCKIWGATEEEVQPAVMAEPEPVAEPEPEPEAAPSGWWAEYRAFNERREKVGMRMVSMMIFFKAEQGDKESIEQLKRLNTELELKENPPPKPEPKPVAEEVKTEPDVNPYDDGLGW